MSSKDTLLKHIETMLLLLIIGLISLHGVNCFAPASNTLRVSKSCRPSQPLQPLLQVPASSIFKICSNRSNDRFSNVYEYALRSMVKEGTTTEIAVEDLQKIQSSSSTTIYGDQQELQEGTKKIALPEEISSTSSFSYGDFAKQYPFQNNIAIATAKTGAADLIAQTIIGHTPLMEVDMQRFFLFALFGAVYSGGFQYLYQVQIFKKLFDIEEFTNATWKEKLQDKEGLKTLAAQTALDLMVMTFVYLPSFYIFKAGVFSGSTDPNVWLSTGLGNYVANFSSDEVAALGVWGPADLVCFSIPLYLRLPVRHSVSFIWTAYLSFARGGH